MLKKIVILGPESTGKSTLSEQLASHFKTLWVPEFAREYLQKNGTLYSFEDLLVIAKEQVAMEDLYIDKMAELQRAGSADQTSSLLAPSLLFVDTDMYVMKVWCEFVFNRCHNWILNQIAKRKYDLYLLCNVDLPWIKDDLREYPDPEPRNKLYRYYKDLLVNQSTPWYEISGDYEQRFNRAVQVVDSILS